MPEASNKPGPQQVAGSQLSLRYLRWREAWRQDQELRVEPRHLMWAARSHLLGFTPAPCLRHSEVLSFSKGISSDSSHINTTLSDSLDF